MELDRVGLAHRTPWLTGKVLPWGQQIVPCRVSRGGQQGGMFQTEIFWCSEASAWRRQHLLLIHPKAPNRCPDTRSQFPKPPGPPAGPSGSSSQDPLEEGQGAPAIPSLRIAGRAWAIGASGWFSQAAGSETSFLCAPWGVKHTLNLHLPRKPEGKAEAGSLPEPPPYRIPGNTNHSPFTFKTAWPCGLPRSLFYPLGAQECVFLHVVVSSRTFCISVFHCASLKMNWIHESHHLKFQK